MWESTIGTILKILRKTEQNLEINVDLLVNALEKINAKIGKGLKDFIEKRNEVERFAESDYNQMALSLKKTLELLNFQIREFKLQQMTSELYEIYNK